MPNTSWSKLSWFYKVILFALPIMVVSYLAVENNWFKGNGDALIQQQTDSATNAGETTTTSTEKVNGLFSYLPEKPVEGKLKGVVEVGASGFNSFVVSIDQQKRWEIIAQDFGQSLMYEGLATSADISEGLEKYISSMASQGVDRKDMHFLISSGAQKEPKTKTIGDELKKMGFGVIMVKAQQEGEWALSCILPASYEGTAFVADIGSGNTKLAWVNGENIEVLEAPGSKYYEKDMKNEDVYAMVKEMASKIPSANRKVCFVMGGSPYDLVKQHRNGEERYTVLKNPEDYTAPKPKTKAGLNIYKAIKDGTGCETFVFDWSGNFAIGYLLELAY
jgi:hypothetical protein